HHLRRDAGVVGARNPENALPPHAVPAREDVLDRPPVRVADVEPAGDVGRRDHHDEPRGSGRTAGLEPPVVHPALVPPPLKRGGVEPLRQCLHDGLFLHGKRALGALSYIRRRGGCYSGKPVISSAARDPELITGSLVALLLGMTRGGAARSAGHSTPASSSLMRCLMTTSAAAGIASQAISRTIFSDRRSTTLEARRSISSSLRAPSPRATEESISLSCPIEVVWASTSISRDTGASSAGGAGTGSTGAAAAGASSTSAARSGGAVAVGVSSVMRSRSRSRMSVSRLLIEANSAASGIWPVASSSARTGAAACARRRFVESSCANGIGAS